MWNTINTVLRRWILPQEAAQAEGLEYWRYEFFFMINRLLFFSMITMTTVGIAFFIYFQRLEILLPVVLFNPFFFVLIIGRKINQVVRRWGLILIFFVMGMYLLINYGVQGPALMFLFVHPILAAVLFGRKEAQICLWVNGIILSALSVFLYLSPNPEGLIEGYNGLSWVSIFITFLFLNAVVTNAITVMVVGMVEILDKEISTRKELESEIETRIILEEALQNERESLQVRVDERTSLLAKANEDLMKSMKFKDAFFDSIRHEFRTPIHAISGYTDLLFTKREHLNEKQISYMERIRESADHLLGVINNILDTTSIQAGMLDIQPVILSLKEICKNSLAYVEGDAVRKGVSIVPGSYDGKLNINADPQRFKQVLINLLENSVKYTPEGGAMGINIEQTDTEVRLTVWDTGIGIPDADINNIFEPFYRSENRNVQDVEGTGLGLSLAKQLVEAHDWKLTVDSELGKGSRFTIHIPMRDVTEHTAVLYY